MYCPRCLKSTSAFSTRCPWCTSEHGILQLWLANFLGVMFAVLFLGILVMLVL